MIEKSSVHYKPEKKVVPVIIKELKIKETSLCFSYSSKWLSLNEMLNHGNKLEYLNIFNINDLVIHVKPYDQLNKLDQELALQKLVGFYQKDILHNQKLSLVGAIGPLRGLFNISSAVYVVFSKPYQSGLHRGDIIGAAKGFREGLGTLYGTLAEEGDNVYKKIKKTVYK
jgi:hypothetical protein